MFSAIKPTAAYEGTNLFADPPTFSDKFIRIGMKFNFSIYLENRTKVTTIAFSLQFNPTYVNITKLTANPTNDLPGGVLLIGDWFPAEGRIEAITYGILGASWDVSLARVLDVEVQIMGFTSPGGTVIDIYDMNCYDEYMYNFLAGDCPYDITVYHTSEYIVHPVTVDSTTYYVTTESNSSVTDFNFSQVAKSVYFNVSGATGTKGWVNVTIPKVLLNGEWTILIDGTSTTYIKAENETHTFLYINYTHSTHTITITGTTVVPEYMPQVMLITLIIATIALALIKRKVYILGNKRMLSKR
jgi:hypothetical protein